jgi:DNA-binding CsgD family transcriptional regulator
VTLGSPAKRAAPIERTSCFYGRWTTGWVGYPSVALASLTVRRGPAHREATMQVTIHRSLRLRSRLPRPEREPSDMANEMLIRIIRGLSTSCTLSVLEQQILYHFLFGRSAELTGGRLGIREATVARHLHRIHAKTGTESRRDLLHLGLRLAEQHGITDGESTSVAA